ncbi:hypothetical protein [Priestia megaterium]|uniref:hypothetical protein n=1 Tax=Priestia megaterium TaxID=1404 RepID=UPI001C239526|nr:hypothetical protein [Priestia megaterium]MBU8689510.1 hypothetical protein [Priestia megaterium]
MTKRKTHEEFVEQVHGLVGNEYELLEKYVDAKTKIEIKHNKCNHVYSVNPNKFLGGRRCPKCSIELRAKNKRVSHTEFIKKFHDLVGNEYGVCEGEVYTGNDIHIKVKHNKCSHEYLVLPSNFLRGTRCPKCFGNFKKSTDDFKKKIYHLVADEYEVCEGEEYENAHTKLMMKHNKCGHTYTVAPNKFVQGRRCPKCSKEARGKSRRLSSDEFMKRLFEVVGDEYGVLEEYTTSKTHIKVKHNVCQHEYSVLPGNILKGSKCPKCFGNIKKDTDYFKKEIYDAVGDEYEVLGEYVNSNTHIEIKHNTCGHTWGVYPLSILKGSRCPNCYGNVKKTIEQFKQEVYDLVGNEYEICENEGYKNANSTLMIRHNTCGHKYSIRRGDFLRGNRCPKCRGLIKKTTEIFKEEVMKLTNKQYELVGEYKSAREHVEIKHNVCGHIWNIKPNNFLNGHRCPNCVTTHNSKGIYSIKNYLSHRGISYTLEQKFDDCFHKERLPFDIFISKSNILIEFDGIQHFKPVGVFGGEETFEYRIKNDQIKNDYCIKHGIQLIRIPYWEQEKIDDILDSVLGYFNVINKDNVNKKMIYKYWINHPDWSYEKYTSEAPCNKAGSQDIQSI